MDLRYGREALGRFAVDCEIGPATMTRIKARDTSIGIDLLGQIADHFGIAPWQLLAPDLGGDLYAVHDERRQPHMHVIHDRRAKPVAALLHLSYRK